MKPVALGRLAICLTLFPLAVQAAPDQINRSLARQLGESSEGDEELVWLSVPPQSESLLGAVVTPIGNGFAVIDRLPEDVYKTKETWKTKGPIGDMVAPAAESPLVGSFLSCIKQPKKSYLGRFEANDVKLLIVVPKTPNTISNFLAKSKPTQAAAKAKKKVYFVKAAYEGAVEIRLLFKEPIKNVPSSALPHFKLQPLTPEAREAVLKPEKPVEFAYQMDAVGLVFSNKSTAPEVQLSPSPPRAENHSKWEQQPRPMAAMAAPNRVDEENFYRVSVFYASDRFFGEVTPDQKQKAFWLCFLSYFMTGSAWLLLGIATGLCIVGLLIVRWRGVKTRIGLSVLILLLANVVVGGIAGAFFAGQNYEQTTALREELSYGICEVSIPRNHSIGIIEQPVSHFLIRFEPEDPEKHFVVLDRKSLEGEPFFHALDSRLDQSPERECFVFVHGYNNTFDDAAKRTAQLWYDLQFPGAPIFFSWPSQGNRAGYTFDENNAEWAQEDFEKFIWDLHTRSTAKRIHIIAHSMGNRIVAKSLENLSVKGVLSGEDCKFREIVLAAPDIDADTFKTRIAPKFARQRPHVTLYASKNDEALKASWEFHDYPRAGDTTKGIVIVDGMDSIDASSLDTNLDTHSYFAAQKTVVSDLSALIVKGKKPPERDGLEESMVAQQKYWIFKG
jgi:esterase/lipase superfamily enzyme